MTWYDLAPLGKQFIPDYNSAKRISTGQVFVVVIIQCELLHFDGQHCTYVVHTLLYRPRATARES